MSDFTSLGAEAAEWTEYAKTWSPPVPPAGATPQQIREGANRNTAKLFDTVVGRPETGLVVTEHSVPVTESLTEHSEAGNVTIPVRVYRPEAATTRSSVLPVYLFFHGGGYFLGNLDTEDANCRHLALQTGVAVVNVGYRHTPEHPFPAAADDAWAAYRWVATSAEAPQLGLDARRIVAGGISAGATLAISVALRANDKSDKNDKNDKKVAGLVLTVPATVHPDHFPAERIQGGAQNSSFVLNADAPFINAARLSGLLNMYQPTPATHPSVSPLLLAQDDLKGLGPVAVHVAGRDPLRDEGLLFEENLRAAGVATTLYTYPGLPHAFMSHPKLASTAVWRQRMWDDVKRIAGAEQS
ncbi:hypothetical protein SCUCBS95973_009730 [Sporothrix curviconia]|uniref:Alpha/beta hydrolase fold-3 domain-containing protein n=1 Tax=Sporothrix curviconia TaxID=1260050 RepID=A0ABP0CXB9_9PEZI